MKVYNAEKTQLLTEYNLNEGFLREDVLVHTIAEVNEVKQISHYEVVKTYENGGQDLKEVIEVEGVPYSPAREQEEKILVFIPYTAEQKEERRKQLLREERTRLLVAFDKWEKAVLRNRETDDSEIMQWFAALLDLDDEAIQNVPVRVQYYL